MKDTLLSIVLITKRNTSFHLKRALESAIGQTYPDKEILVVDANTPGDPYSLGLLEDLGQYPEAVLIQTGINGTDSFCRNFALKQVSGKYVAFMDGNDYWEPAKAVMQIEQLKTNEFAAASCSNGLILYERPRGFTSEVFFERLTYDIRRWVLDKPVRTGSQVVYLTVALLAVGGFDDQFERLGDLDMMIRLSENYKILFFPVTLFETYLASNDPDRLCPYEDGCLLMRKYADLFLLSRSVSYEYCLLLAKQAAGKYRLFRALTHLVQSFLSAPVHSVVSLIAATLRLIPRAFRLFYQYAAALITVAKLLISVHRGKSIDTAEQRPLNSSAPLDITDVDQKAQIALTAKKFSRYAMFQFAGNHQLRAMAIPDCVTVLKKGMFFGCENLVSVVIPNTVTRIDAYAFQNCRSLNSVFFQPGSKLTEIGAYVFAGCVSLTILRLPGKLSKIGKGVFAGCVNLQGFEFTCFGGNEEITELNFPSSLRIIPKHAFAGCAKLQKVVFGDGSMLDRVDAAAFFHCSGLETVSLTGTVDSIKTYAFAGCVKLNKFDMPMIDAVSEIGSHAFEFCSGLPSVQIPFALKRINFRSYYGCTAINKVKIPAGVQIIDHHAFGQCISLKTAILMNADTIYYKTSFPPETQIDKYNPSSEKYI